MIHRFLNLCGLIALLLVSPAVSSAQVDATRMDGMEGNWRVKFSGAVDERSVSDFKMSVFQDRTHECEFGAMSGCFFDQYVAESEPWKIVYAFGVGQKYGEAQERSFNEKSGNIKHAYWMYGRWGGKEQAQLSGNNTVKGKIKYKSYDASTRWSRITPTISKVEALNSKEFEHVVHSEMVHDNHLSITLKWQKRHWSNTQNFPGQRPLFKLEFTGSDMWGQHYAYFPYSLGVDTGVVRYEPSKDQGAEKLSFWVSLWPGFQPGRQILYVSGQKFIVDIAVTDMPKPEGQFQIGDISVKRESTPLTQQKLQSATRDAAFARDSARESLQAARQTYAKTAQSRLDRLKPVRQSKADIIKQLSALEKEGLPELDKVVEMPAYQNFEVSVGKLGGQIDEVNRVIEVVFAAEGQTDVGRARIAALNAERDSLEAERNKLLAQRDEMLEPKRLPETTTKIRALKAKLENTVADLNRRDAIDGPQVDRARDKVLSRAETMKTAAQTYNDAYSKLKTWDNNSGLRHITELKTRHASFIPPRAGEVEQLMDFAREIRQEAERRKRKRPELEQDRELARVAMLEAGAAADAANERLRNVGFFSVWVQYSIEGAFSAYDLVKASEFGPGAVLGEAVRQAGMNLIMPPTYYDATSASLSDYTGGNETARDLQHEDIDISAAEKPAQSVIQSAWANMNLDAALKRLKVASASHEFKSAQSLFRASIRGEPGQPLAGASNWKRLSRASFSRETILKQATEDWGDAVGKNGLKALSGSIISDWSTNIAKGAGKEAAKKAFAEAIEGYHLRDYIEAQLTLRQAVAKYRYRGDLKWDNEDAIEILEPIYLGLLSREDSNRNLVEVRNKPFTPAAGYEVEIKTSGQNDMDVGAADAELYLGGQKLTRKPVPGKLVWTVNPKVAKYFKDMNVPENSLQDLSVELRVK